MYLLCKVNKTTEAEASATSYIAANFPTRHDRPCEYWRPAPTTRSVTASTPENPWSLSPPSDDNPNIRSIDFSSILFLDPGLLQHGLVETVRSTPPVPPHILHLLGDLDEIRFTAERFFNHIHRWMPFISKKRFYDLHLLPSFHTRSDVVLLFVAMKLITTFPPTDSQSHRTALYHAAKHFHLRTEECLSILVLQAGLLIALYELGHGIYPAAFLSIGACASTQKKVLTLVEVEERRRVWWAIVVLDRFISIGCPGRPFATADPKLDDLLPSDDAAWDEGIVKPDRLSALSYPTTGNMSKFALVCQAARLLGQALHFLSHDPVSQDGVWQQLDRTLHSMLTAALNIDSPDYDQITFIYSALVALYTPWLSSNANQKIDNDYALRASLTLQQITDRINANLIERQCFLGRNQEDISPWGLYFAYRVCGAHMRPDRSSDSADVSKTLRETLQVIDMRWGVAGVYLQLLEAQEAIHHQGS
ncbi:hypothetical protein N7540_008296 [Penicillium herquei]|nr:hypothetical protein N7540_008296 [Penicillium herquei]